MVIGTKGYNIVGRIYFLYKVEGLNYHSIITKKTEIRNGINIHIMINDLESIVIKNLSS
ncbi:hypothetical protein BACFRA24663_07095 [Bacteroides fragilis]